MSKLRIKRNDIIKEINVTKDKEQTSIPYIRFKRDYGEYYSNLIIAEGHTISEASNGCFVIDGKVWVIKDESVIDDKAEHIMGMILTEEGNGGTWVRVNDKLETIDFDPNNGIYKNIQEVENDRHGKLIEIPPVYVKTETFTEGEYEGKTCWWIADYPADGFHIHPAFIDEDGNPGVLRVSKNWSTKSDSDYSNSNDPDSSLNKWQSEGIRAYSIYDHHIICRLILVEFGTTDLYNLIKVDDSDDEENDYNKTTNYRGIENVMGDPDEWSQYKLAGIYADGYGGNIQVWKNNGSLEFYDTGLEVTSNDMYPLTTYTDKFDNVDMGDIFIGKDNVDDSLNWDEKQDASTFKAYQSFYGDIYVGTMYPGMFNLDGLHDANEVYRFVQVETVLDKINIKEAPETINIIEYYGVPFDQVELPDKVTITLEDGSIKNSSVIWDGSKYNPMSSGSQMVEAEILLNGRAKNDNGYKATANITVEDMPEQTVKNINYYARDKIGNLYDMEKIPRENIKDLTNIKVEPNASHAFESCYALKEFPPTYFNTWDTSEVTDMNSMFHGTSKITSLDLSNFDTSNLTDAGSMFYGCNNLKTLNTNNWDTSNVTNFRDTFRDCNNLESSVTIENLRTDNVTDISGMLESTRFETLNLSDWNTSNVKTMMDLFMRCSSLKQLDVTGWDTSNVVEFTNMFNNCNSLENIEGIENFTISGIDDSDYNYKGYNYKGINYMFDGCRKLESLNLNGWIKDSNKINSLNGVFSNCYVLERITGIEDFDTSNVTEMMNTFYNCKVLTADLSNWNTSKVTKMSSMLLNCDLNKLTGWDTLDTSEVVNMRYMFNGCKAPIVDNTSILKIDRLNTHKVTDMSYMLGNSDASTINIKNMNVNEVEDMSYMFDNCKNLSTLISAEDFLETGKVKNFSYMFQKCTSLPTVFPYIIDVTGIQSSNYMRCMFYGSSVRDVTLANASDSLKSELEKSPQKIGHNYYNADGFTIHFITNGFNLFEYAERNITGYMNITELPEGTISTLTNIKPRPNASKAFCGCNKLTSIPMANTWDMSKVTNMEEMFTACDVLETLDISNWNTTKEINARCMFYRCFNLNTLNMPTNTFKINNAEAMFYLARVLKEIDLSHVDTTNNTTLKSTFGDCREITSLDLSNFVVTNKVTTIEDAFDNCIKLTTITGIENWDTSNVTSMAKVFSGCNSLTSLNISNWKTDNVTSFRWLFWGDNNLPELDLSGWKFDKITSTEHMFRDCSSLRTLILDDNLSCDKLKYADYMFKNCSSLKTFKLSWSTASLERVDGLFENCTSLESIDLSEWKNTSNLKNLRFAFENCNSLESIDTSKIDLSNIDMIDYFLASCDNLKSANVPNLCGSKTRYINNIFAYCSELKSVDLSSWDTSNVEDMSQLFVNCEKLESVNLSGWNTSKMKDLSQSFWGCKKLIGEFPITIDCSSITSAEEKEVTGLQAMFGGGCGITKVRLKNVRSDLKSKITASYLGKSELTLEVEFVN